MRSHCSEKIIMHNCCLCFVLPSKKLFDLIFFSFLKAKEILVFTAHIHTRKSTNYFHVQGLKKIFLTWWWLELIAKLWCNITETFFVPMWKCLGLQEIGYHHLWIHTFKTFSKCTITSSCTIITFKKRAKIKSFGAFFSLSRALLLQLSLKKWKKNYELGQSVNLRMISLNFWSVEITSFIDWKENNFTKFLLKFISPTFFVI